MARKRLTISSGLEQYANAQAQGTSSTMDVETAKAEALAHLRAREHLQTIDELRKALAVVATNTGVDVLHAGTPAPFAAAARTVLMDAFGGCSGAEVEEAIAGAACNATDRSFVVAARDGDAVAAAGVVVEHRFRRADGSPAVTWELLWLACPERRRGAGGGGAAWAAIARVAAVRGVDGILVPSTDAALLFWARRATPRCPMSRVVLREESEAGDWIARSANLQKKGHVHRVRKLVAYRKLQICASPFSAKAAAPLKGLYAPRAATASLPAPSKGGRRGKARRGAVVAAPFEAEPNRWSPRAATHFWFFPGGAAPVPTLAESGEEPARVEVTRMDPRPRGDSFFEVREARDRADSYVLVERPRADSTFEDAPVVVGG